MIFEPIITALREREVSLAGSIVEIPDIEGGVFVPVHVSRRSDGTLKPPKRTFIELKALLELSGYHPEFIFVNERVEEAEHSLRSSLLVSFPDLIRNAFLSITPSNSKVWIEQKRAINEAERSRINDHIEKFVGLFRLPTALVSSLADTALPTRIEILSSIRQSAPVDCETLRDILVKRGLTVPSLDWINRQFDLLRKSSLIVRRSDRHYATTLDGLKRLGTRKNRNSPDIQRLLALAKGAV